MNQIFLLDRFSLFKFSLKYRKWSIIDDIEDPPSLLEGQSCSMYKNSIIFTGGVLKGKTISDVIIFDFEC